MKLWTTLSYLGDVAGPSGALRKTHIYILVCTYINSIIFVHLHRKMHVLVSDTEPCMHAFMYLPSSPTPKCMWNFQLKRHEENLFFRGPGLKIRNSSISFCFSHFRLNHPFGSIPYSSHPAKAKNTQRETTEAKKKWVKRCTTQEKIDPNHTSELSNF